MNTIFTVIFYFLYKLHRMQKFGSNVDFRKVDFLIAEKISHRSRFLTNVNNENIFNKMLV